LEGVWMIFDAVLHVMEMAWLKITAVNNVRVRVFFKYMLKRQLKYRLKPCKISKLYSKAEETSILKNFTTEIFILS
jgi:hypothetical protein